MYVCVCALFVFMGVDTCTYSVSILHGFCSMLCLVYLYVLVHRILPCDLLSALATHRILCELRVDASD